MRVYDILHKKRCGLELTAEEIAFLIEGYSNNDITDYQMAAFAMAVCINGMSARETSCLTMEMAKSGNMIDLSALGITVDKHSTGGVGDKTTLIVAPIAASLGCKIAKMSGRGLGHTGGTVDKLESIPGFKVELSADKFFDQVEKVGVCVVGQTGSLAPADKKLYALRDVTATVDSIPLIASSIMSKKIAAGAKNIVIDVKCGSGAFMKKISDSRELANLMVGIGKDNDRNVAAIISNMDVPLGHAVGNTLEVKEAINVLCGKGPQDLFDLCIELSGAMYALSFNVPRIEGVLRARECVRSGRALDKFKEWIAAQGGEACIVDNPNSLQKSKIIHTVVSSYDGYIFSMDAETIGIAASVTGAGRMKKSDSIDYSAGIIIKSKTGDRVKRGDVIAEIHTSTQELAEKGASIYLSAITFGQTPPQQKPLIIDAIGI